MVHLVLILEARGYGLVVFCSLLLAYSIYSYLVKPGKTALISAMSAAVAGTLTIPTFGFFGLPLFGLLVMVKRSRQTLCAVFLCYAIIASVYLPLLPEMLAINAGYSNKWGAEFGSYKAVLLTLKNYLLPDTDSTFIVLILSVIVTVALLPWRKLASTAYIEPWRPVALSILLFFGICLLLETPAARTTAFISLPTAVIVVSFTPFFQKQAWLKYFWLLFVLLSSGFIYKDFVDKRKTVDVYYRPNESWKQSAEIIQHLFPPETIKLFSTFRPRLLRKYLPREYEVLEDFSDRLFNSGNLILVDSHPSKNERISKDPKFADAELFRTSQVRAEYQAILYHRPDYTDQFKISFAGNNKCGFHMVDKGVERLNSCINYIDDLSVEILFGESSKVYSFNIAGTGLSESDILSVEGKSGNRWVKLLPDSVGHFFKDERKWKRNQNSSEEVLSILLRSNVNWERLSITFGPVEVGKSFSLSSMWYYRNP